MDTKLEIISEHIGFLHLEKGHKMKQKSLSLFVSTTFSPTFVIDICKFMHIKMCINDFIP